MYRVMVYEKLPQYSLTTEFLTTWTVWLPWFQYHFLLFCRVFLVRESRSSPGSFVLTFKCSGKVLHSQIQPVSLCSVSLLSQHTDPLSLSMVQGLSWEVLSYQLIKNFPTFMEPKVQYSDLIHWHIYHCLKYGKM